MFIHQPVKLYICVYTVQRACIGKVPVYASVNDTIMFSYLIAPEHSNKSTLSPTPTKKPPPATKKNTHTQKV